MNPQPGPIWEASIRRRPDLEFISLLDGARLLLEQHQRDGNGSSEPAYSTPNAAPAVPGAPGGKLFSTNPQNVS